LLPGHYPGPGSYLDEQKRKGQKAARLLREGAIFAFGLSERAHGADIYNTDTTLAPKGDDTWVANGEKYYIGNGNEAEMVSTMGKIKDGTDDYAFFVTNYRHKAYELKKNVISTRSTCPTCLHDYPIRKKLLSRVRRQDAALIRSILQYSPASIV
jgi:acyl-CoA dehydrogenase